MTSLKEKQDKPSRAPVLTLNTHQCRSGLSSHYLFLQIVIATLVSWQMNLNEKYGVDVVGQIPSG